jgi:hypothetical protein
VSSPTTPALQLVPSAAIKGLSRKGTTTVARKAASKTAGKTVAIAGIAEAVSDMATAASRYGAVRQLERTKRQSIRVEERVSLARIGAQERLLGRTIDGELHKQDKVIDAGCALLHHAMSTNDPTHLELAVTLLVETVKVCPLRSAALLGGGVDGMPSKAAPEVPTDDEFAVCDAAEDSTGS